VAQSQKVFSSSKNVPNHHPELEIFKLCTKISTISQQ
jgi:hypothetical protein